MAQPTLDELKRAVVMRDAENARLKAAGDRILGLLSRLSDHVTDDEAREHQRMVDSLRRIWVEAKHPGSVR